MVVKLFFDGASKGNPGKAGCGWYIENSEKGYKFLGNATNNQAEYQGMIEGLKTARKENILELEVYGDSKLVIEQMKGNWQVKSPNIKHYYQEAREICKHFDNLSFFWIKRDKNKVADYLANQAILKMTLK